MRLRTLVAVAMTVLTYLVTAPQITSQTLPNPVLVFTGAEAYKTGGKEWTRYKFAVYNRDAYPNELFAAAPDLPPCGTNTKSSRTWVDIFDQSGKRLNGFCSLSKNADLNNIYFNLEPEALPPSWVYIEMKDRKANIMYKSNLAETTL